MHVYMYLHIIMFNPLFSKASIQLKAFTEDAVRLNTLPRDDHAALDVVFKLFMRPGWQVSVAKVS